MRLYAILDDHLRSDHLIRDIYSRVPELKSTIYQYDTVLFLEFAVGFITGMSIELLAEMRFI